MKLNVFEKQVLLNQPIRCGINVNGLFKQLMRKY